MVNDSQIKITDAVVMGDINQTISGNECPGCFAANVRVMMCQISDCETKFCELCHAKSRFSEGHFERFDSGHGSGPFCAKCLISTKNQYEEKKRLERERVEREKVEYEEKKRLEGEKVERERVERERVERERERVERERLEKRARSKMVKIFVATYFGFVLIYTLFWSTLDSGAGEAIPVSEALAMSGTVCSPISLIVVFILWYYRASIFVIEYD